MCIRIPFTYTHVTLQKTVSLCNDLRNEFFETYFLHFNSKHFIKKDGYLWDVNPPQKKPSSLINWEVSPLSVLLPGHWFLLRQPRKAYPNFGISRRYVSLLDYVQSVQFAKAW